MFIHHPNEVWIRDTYCSWESWRKVKKRRRGLETFLWSSCTMSLSYHRPKRYMTWKRWLLPMYLHHNETWLYLNLANSCDGSDTDNQDSETDSDWFSYRLRDRSLFIAWRGQGILGGITWFLGEQNGWSVVTENSSRRGVIKNLGRIHRRDQWRHGRGIAKAINSYWGGLLRWSNIQRGDRLNFNLFNPKFSAATLVINNDRSLKGLFSS